jgi:hypothetical protein
MGAPAGGDEGTELNLSILPMLKQVELLLASMLPTSSSDASRIAASPVFTSPVAP